MIGSEMWNEKKDKKKIDKNDIHHCFTCGGADYTSSFYMDGIDLI